MEIDMGWSSSRPKLSAMRRPSFIPLRRIAPLGLALALAVAAPPARAAFPGVPGPIVYPKLNSDGVGDDRGGLFLHGPRVRQKARPLTGVPGDGSPSFSADGRLIVFTGNRDPAGSTGIHVYVVNSDGSGLRQLTSAPSFDANPSFAPNGQRVVFDRRVAGRSHVFAVNVDGSGLRQLTTGNRNESDPVYTPNGRRIVFVGDRDRDARTDQSDIFAMAPSGADPRVLIDGPYTEEEPDTSPNGRRIAFVSNRQPGINIFVAESNGRVLRQLTHNRRSCSSGACNRSPAWAPDGKHIAFLSIGRYNSDLMVMRSDGGGEKEFAGGGTETEGFGTTIGSPGWGPAHL
jgi:Tol biopolymer transport system component